MKRPTSVVGRHVSVYGNVCNANSPATKGNCEERVSKNPIDCCRPTVGGQMANIQIYFIGLLACCW